MHLRIILIFLASIFCLTNLSAQLTLSATAGTTAASYATFDAAFTAINAGTHQGIIAISINADVTELPNPTILIASGQGSASYTSLTIKPTAVVTVSASNTAGRGVFVFDGCDNVTIDGSITVGGTTKDLTIVNTSANTVANTTAIRVIGRTTLGLGVLNFTLKNCIVRGSTPGNNGYSGSNLANTYSFYAGGTSATSLSAIAAGNDYDNMTIQNNNFENAFLGFYFSGGATTQADNLLIEGNNFGSASFPIGSKGMVMSQVVNGVFRDNKIFDILSLASVDLVGLEITGFSTIGLTVERNEIYNIKNDASAGFGAYGINITAGDNINFYNNVIHGISSVNYATSSSKAAFGVRLAGGINCSFYYNSINIYGNYTNASSPNAFSVAFGVVGSGVSGLNVKNNIFCNRMTSNAIDQEFVAISFPSSYNFANANLDNNAYMVANDSKHLAGKIGYFFGSPVYDLTSTWQAVSQINNATNDVNSIPLNNKVVAPFISNTNLNIAASTITEIESGGVAIASIGLPNTDKNILTRPAFSGTNPDIGAYEFNGVFPSETVLPILSSISLITPQACTNLSHTVSVNASDNIGVQSIKLFYSYNGVSQGFINLILTSGTIVSGNWEGLIPAAFSPQTIVSYYAIAYDASGNESIAIDGFSYQDNQLGNLPPIVNTSDTSICSGSNAILTASTNYQALGFPAYGSIPSILNPTSEEDLGNITITEGATTILNNTTAVNSLTGTLGVATGTVGAYSNFTAFGPFTFIRGHIYNYSVTNVISGSGSFGSSMAIFIDYNRDGDFSDVGERVHTAIGNVVGPHTESGSFTIPNSVKYGLTKMRVSVDEGTIYNPEQPFNFGEYEEYTILLQPQIDSIIWSDGSMNIGMGSPLVVSPVVNTTYTPTLYSNACSISTAPSVTVNVAPVLVMLIPQNASCNGVANGGFSLGTVSCGNAPFTYSIDGSGYGPIPTNLSAGTHSVIVQDNIGQFSNPFNLVISQPSALPAPSPTAGVSICVSSPSAIITANAGSNSVSYFSATSGGTFQGNGSPFQTVGTLLLPNTNTPGTYIFYAQTDSSGCASATRTPISVIVKPTSQSTNTITSCDSLIWINGVTYYASNNVASFTYPGGGANGCDSTVFLNLTIKFSTSATQNVTSCNTYLWPQTGLTYTNSGVFKDTIPNTQGCDSIITLNLTINSSYADTTIITTCDTYLWSVNSQTYNTSGMYSVTFMNAAGCDSIKNLNLIIKNSTTAMVPVTACDSYLWPSTMVTYNVSGLYNDTLINSVGCDSIVTLNLTIKNSTSALQTVIVCDDYIWPQNSITYIVSGNYFDTIPNTAGCDSVIQLALTINNSYTDTSNIVACNTYLWSVNSTSYTTSGQYVANFLNAAGCDSIKVLNLTINNSSTATVVVTACDSYFWPSTMLTYNVSGMYNDTLLNAVGCDSVVTLNLTINNSSSSMQTIVNCDSYTWPQNSMTYNSSGIYSDTILNTVGCDSIINLNLTINNSYIDTAFISACDSFLWTLNNVVYYTSGFYSIIDNTVNGCDSIRNLSLTISQSSSSSQSITNCGAYQWPLNNITYSFSGTYIDTIANSAGCDSIATLNLTINSVYSFAETIVTCDEYFWTQNSMTYTSSGIYTDNFTTQEGCDSIYTLNLTINNVNAVATNNGDLTISASSGAMYQWINCPSGISLPGEMSSTLTVSTNGQYAVIITGSTGCVDTSNCVVIDNVGLKEFQNVGLSLYPNPTMDGVYLNFEGLEAELLIVDENGREVFSKIVKSNDYIDLENLEPAVYYLHITIDTKEDILKLVKM